MRSRPLIEKYRRFLPVTDKTPIVSLAEGGTPLVMSCVLSDLTGCRTYLKLDGLNPTGSFKDRGMTVAVSKAKEAASRVVMCASTGNTSASAAAYAARAGMKCVVLIPEGAVALGKLAQALIHGAQVLAIRGNFDDALNLVRDITSRYPITLVNSVNPYRIDGQKTGAFEICDELGGAPTYHAMPVGNAGNITAYWKGYKEYRDAGRIKSLPQMLGFQASGAAPIVRGRIVKHPKTVATAIRIGNPASWKQAVAARDESGGLIDTVTDKEIMDAYKLLAARDGVFVEPASASAVAGVIKLGRRGYFRAAGASDEVRLVCVLTGNGLKDPDVAIKSIKRPKIIKPDQKLILKEIGF